MVTLPDTVPAPLPSISAVCALVESKVIYPPVVKVPVVTFNMPETFNVPPKVTPELLLMVRFFIALPENTPEGIVWDDDPFISTPPLETVNVPEFEIAPAICNVPPLTFSVAPLCIVTLWLGKVPEIITG